MCIRDRYVGEGTIVNSEFLNGLNIEQAKTKIIKEIEKLKIGEKKITFRLKDWGISRQRYWGAPIPMLSNEDGDLVAESDENLPVALPEEVEFDGVRSPLKNMSDFYEINDRDVPLIRETDTFDTFMESSWYYARFCSSDSDKAMLDERAKYWLPVDLYIGGIEHAILHLLYARFYHKLLRDEGLVEGNEPFKRLLTQGMVLNDGAKMSKSLGNTVDPEEMIQNYGADTARLFMLSDSPPERDMEWTESGVEGASRFLKRVWRISQDPDLAPLGAAPLPDSAASALSLVRMAHKSIISLSADIENFRFNRAVAQLHMLANAIAEVKKQDKGAASAKRFGIETLVQLLSPLSPHIAEEMWQGLGHETMLAFTAWPKADENLADDDEIEVVIDQESEIEVNIESEEAHDHEGEENHEH